MTVEHEDLRGAHSSGDDDSDAQRRRTLEAQDAHGGSMAPDLADELGRPVVGDEDDAAS